MKHTDPHDAKIPSRAKEHRRDNNGQYSRTALCSYPNIWWIIQHRPTQEALWNMLVRPLPHLALTNQLCVTPPPSKDTMILHRNTFIKHALW